MIPVFSDDAEWARFKDICLSWRGTPYRHLQRTKGRGADCAAFIASCFLEAGYLTTVDWPEYYPRDWALHTKAEYVLEGIYWNTQRNLIPGLTLKQLDSQIELMRGDWLAISTTRREVSNHACILWDDADQFIHSIEGKGVCFAALSAPMKLRVPWYRMPRKVFRLYKEGK